MSNLATDTFTGTNGDPWNAQWVTGLNPTSGAVTPSIQSNRGRLTSGNLGSYNGNDRIARRLNITNPVDAVVLFSFQWASGDECYPRFYIRSTNTSLDSQGGYWLELNKGSNYVAMGKGSSYSNTGLPSLVANGQASDRVTWNWSTGQKYWCRFGVVGTTVRFRVWQDGSSEPSTWDKTATDSTHTTAGSGVGITMGGGAAASRTWDWDDFSLDTTWPIMDVPGTAALTTGTALSATGATAPSGGAALTTATAVTAGAMVTQKATAALTTATAVTPFAVATALSTAALSTGTSVSASGSNAPVATVALTTGTAIVAGAMVEEFAAAALTTGTAVAAAGTRTVEGSADLTTGASLSADGKTTQVAQAALTTATELSTTGFDTALAACAMSVTTALSSVGVVGPAGDVAMTVHTALATTVTVLRRGQASLSLHTVVVAVGAGYTPPEPTRGRVQIYARNAALQILGEIDDFVECNATKVYNDVGSWELQLSAASPNADLIDPSLNVGGGIVIRLDGKVFMTGPVLQMSDDWSSEQGKNDMLTLSGTDDNIWLAYRNIYPNPAQTPETMSASYYRTASLAAESIMIDLVNKNMGPGALVARRLSHISIPATLVRGKVQKSPKYRFDTVLESLQQLSTLSRIGTDQTTDLMFNLQQEGTSLVFRVSNGAGKASLIRFSKALGTLKAYNRTTTAATATNLVLGAGLEEVPDDASGARIAKALFSYERTDPSYPGRKEQFVDVGAIDPTTGDAGDIQEQLDQQANDTFNTASGQVGATLAPYDTTFQTFGVDYDIGDFCTVVLPRLTFVERVREAALTRDVDNGTQIVISVGSANGGYQRRSSGTYRRISDLKHYTDRLKREK